MDHREKIIHNYIVGYNQFNINKIVVDFDDKNIQEGQVSLSLSGLEVFRQQAELVCQTKV